MSASAPEALQAGDTGHRRPIALTIAGFDPSSGAGVTADLKVFAAHGLYGEACITALTIQSTLGVRRVEPVASDTLRDTLDCLREDVLPSGIKIGMMATAGNVTAIATFLEESSFPSTRVVLDPVLRSSSGRELLSVSGVEQLRSALLPRVGWITPNLDELAVLTGAASVDRAQIPAAALRLQQMAAAAGNPALNVVVTGGHLDRPDDYLLSATGEASWLPGERVETSATHGTGCAFSSALLCAVLQGQLGNKAVAAAKEYVTAALKAAYPVGRGKGPMHHLFALEGN